MTTLTERVRAALGDPTDSSWEDLIRLFEANPETFYELACDGVGSDAIQGLQVLASAANLVRSAIQESYEIEPSDEGATLVTRSGRKQFIPNALLPRVGRFLRSVDGKGDTQDAGKDYVGTAISESETRFKLGARSSWNGERAKIQAQLESQPLVLRISDEEIEHLKSQPPYVTYGLLNCARRTVLAPTSVFKGLNRGDVCPSDLQEGWAFCGKPRQAFDNQGRQIAVPEKMVYLVYANEDKFVFDWDWVKEDSGEPGYPVDWRMRFGNPLELQQDAAFDLPKNLLPGAFDAAKACYSSKGDCIFCYMSDEVSYATRINADLTVFNALSGDQYTGFKVKNVRRILEVDQSIVIHDAPGLTVSVDAVLLATLKRDPHGDVQFYSVLIQALHNKISPSPKVHVPPRASVAA